ncbi:putative Arginine repressor ArgR [Streptococcus sp. DD10]|uniref:arginine repressor n=1 Tax=Streptococcus sp. DD10 TaxID=1777878 RepID=UPI0007936BDC|nr:arginine repressor [Streptococcus sp. DD10]KXT73651.1 putative Arginine repressor ArgR [Streptococcus sp. DD10]
MNKKERLEKIRRFVTENEVRTQDEIVKHLSSIGIIATQATVSRDIKELGMVKIPLKENAYKYDIPKLESSTYHLVDDNILAAESMGNMVNVSLVPGSGMVVKNQIIDEFGDYIFSIIVDDDSVFLVVRKEHQAQLIVETLKHW